MNILLSIIIVVLLIALFVTIRENNLLKRERDYYREVDEENERLRKLHGEK